MRNVFKVLFFLISGLIIYTSCKHELPESTSGGGGTSNPPPVVTIKCSADTVYFQNAVLPVIVSNCAMSGCHNTTSHRSGIILETYAGVRNLVKAGNASGSELISIITTSNNGDVMPPPPLPRLTTTQINDIKKWINQGAQNNLCNECDTTQFTFNIAVKSIMQNRCVGCHTGVAASAGIDLSTYTGVKTVAQNGRLMGSVKHLSGYVAMPPGGTAMPDCEIKQLQKWIDAGSLNN